MKRYRGYKRPEPKPEQRIVMRKLRAKWFFTRSGAYGGGWVASLLVGSGDWIGAGYIGGFTAFVAWNSGSLNWQRSYNGGLRYAPLTIGKLELGITQNANRVPYTAH